MRSMTSSLRRVTAARWLRRSGLVAIVALPALGVSCGGAPELGSLSMAPVPRIAQLYYSDSGAIRDSMRLVIRDAGTFRDHWADATSDRTQPPEPPVVDFENEMVLLVAAGRKRVGDEIRADSARIGTTRTISGGEQEVMSVIVVKVDGCGSFDQDVWPLQLVRVTRYDGDVRFTDRVVQGPDCVRAAASSTGTDNETYAAPDGYARPESQAQSATNVTSSKP